MKSGAGNLFVKNLSDIVDNARLHELFSKFGTILSCKVARNEDGTSRRYGFIQFQSEEAANSAMQDLSNSSLDGKQLYVTNFIKRSERLASNPDDKYSSLYIQNIDQDSTEDLIKLKFSEFGSVVRAKIGRDEDGSLKGFGFVSFESAESARKEKTLYVARAQNKFQRQQFLYEEKRNGKIKKAMGSDLYIKNIDDAMDDSILGDRFAECGNIASVEIMRDEKGISRGFGFECYSSPDEAKNGVPALHGQMLYGKPLFVALAQRKAN